jgi:LPS O-antigen subunit length determinant protein (WzzB/FepE family)
MSRLKPRALFMMIVIVVVVAIALGLAIKGASAQSWTETIFMDDGRICTITYVNGGRQRYVSCIP